MKKIILSLSVALILKATASFGWGVVGHTMVADIAASYLNPGVKDSVQKYLGTMTFGEAATWMDDVRSDHSYDYMKKWHYADVEKDKTYVKTSEKNAVNEIEKVIGELGNKSKLSKTQINTDLKILFHLVGDLHQPLHCGYADDKGGNGIQVEFNGQKSNLHSVWDSKMIDYKLQVVKQQVLELNNKLTDADKKKYEKIDVEEWYAESRANLPQVYDFKNGEITEDYINKSLPIIEKQILIAGIRLASVLNETFKK